MRNFAIIFGMDGVLVDSYETQCRCWGAVSSEMGLDFSADEFARLFGRTTLEIIDALWPGKLTPQQALEFEGRKEQLCRQIMEERLPETPGAGKLVGALHQAGFRLAVSSCGPRATTEFVLKQLGHQDKFSALVSGLDVLRGKPHPETFLLAARRLGLAAEHCAVIESSPSGIQAALRTGMTTIALAGCVPREKLSAAHLVVDSLHEVKPVGLKYLIVNMIGVNRALEAAAIC